jgi:TolA-binding protein
MKTILTLLAACLFVGCSAQEAEKVKQLEQRVKVLEEQVAQLQAAAGKTRSNDNAKKMMKVARQHVEAERQKFKAQDIEKAEELYGEASQMYMQSSKDSKKLLETVVTLYPQLNRAGCAQLYIAQQESGTEKERLLKDCMKRFDACYYLDGTQVGPLATLQLAFYYCQAGKDDDARKLFKQVRDEYPDAVGHDGELLTDKIY